jgi:DNA-binding NtrC family response regulator
LLRYSWPGNVRELRNTLEQTVLLAQGDEIGAKQIPLCHTLSPADPPSPADTLVVLPETGVNLEEVERTLLSQALKNTGWNVSRAARLLGLTRDTLRYRMEKYAFKSPA